MNHQRVVVYLDTSDISRFADIGTDHERGTSFERDSIQQVYASLQRYVDQGDIEIRFSGIHVAEVGKSGSFDPAFRKAQVIERLCGRLCFRPFEEIWVKEIWSLVRSCVGETRFSVPYGAYSDHGVWLFKSTENTNLGIDLKTSVRQFIRDSVRGNRKERRALEARFLRGNRLTDHGQKLSAQHAPGAACEIASRFPMNDPSALVDLFGRLLAGRITATAFETEFVEMLIRPTQIMRFAFEMDEVRKHFPQFVVTFGENVLRAVAQFRAKLTEIPCSPTKGFVRHVPGTVARAPALQAALQGWRPARPRISVERVSQIVERATFGDLPAVDLLSAATRVYIGQHATTPRNPKISDGLDLLHLTYLPYCDVFRADIYIADVLRQCDPMMLAKLARTLQDVPQLIERKRGRIGVPIDQSRRPRVPNQLSTAPPS